MSTSPAQAIHPDVQAYMNYLTDEIRWDNRAALESSLVDEPGLSLEIREELEQHQLQAGQALMTLHKECQDALIDLKGRGAELTDDEKKLLSIKPPQGLQSAQDYEDYLKKPEGQLLKTLVARFINSEIREERLQKFYTTEKLKVQHRRRLLLFAMLLAYLARKKAFAKYIQSNLEKDSAAIKKVIKQLKDAYARQNAHFAALASQQSLYQDASLGLDKYQDYLEDHNAQLQSLDTRIRHAVNSEDMQDIRSEVDELLRQKEHMDPEEFDKKFNALSDKIKDKIEGLSNRIEKLADPIGNNLAVIKNAEGEETHYVRYADENGMMPVKVPIADVDEAMSKLDKNQIDAKAKDMLAKELQDKLGREPTAEELSAAFDELKPEEIEGLARDAVTLDLARNYQENGYDFASDEDLTQVFQNARDETTIAQMQMSSLRHTQSRLYSQTDLHHQASDTLHHHGDDYYREQFMGMVAPALDSEATGDIPTPTLTLSPEDEAYHQLLQDDMADAMQQVERAQKNLTEAEAEGDYEAIATAEAELNQAQVQLEQSSQRLGQFYKFQVQKQTFENLGVERPKAEQEAYAAKLKDLDGAKRTLLDAEERLEEAIEEGEPKETLDSLEADVHRAHLNVSRQQQSMNTFYEQQIARQDFIAPLTLEQSGYVDGLQANIEKASETLQAKQAALVQAQSALDSIDQTDIAAIEEAEKTVKAAQGEFNVAVNQLESATASLAQFYQGQVARPIFDDMAKKGLLEPMDVARARQLEAQVEEAGGPQTQLGQRLQGQLDSLYVDAVKHGLNQTEPCEFYSARGEPCSHEEALFAIPQSKKLIEHDGELIMVPKSFDPEKDQLSPAMVAQGKKDLADDKYIMAGQLTGQVLEKSKDALELVQTKQTALAKTMKTLSQDIREAENQLRQAISALQQPELHTAPSMSHSASAGATAGMGVVAGLRQVMLQPDGPQARDLYQLIQDLDMDTILKDPQLTQQLAGDPVAQRMLKDFIQVLPDMQQQMRQTISEIDTAQEQLAQTMDKEPPASVQEQASAQAQFDSQMQDIVQRQNTALQPLLQLAQKYAPELQQQYTKQLGQDFMKTLEDHGFELPRPEPTQSRGVDEPTEEPYYGVGKVHENTPTPPWADPTKMTKPDPDS